MHRNRELECVQHRLSLWRNSTPLEHALTSTSLLASTILTNMSVDKRLSKRGLTREHVIAVCEQSLTMGEAAAKLGMRYTTFKRYATELDCWQPNQGGAGTRKASTSPHTLEEILAGNVPTYGYGRLKQRLLRAGIKENRCEKCGISEWNGEPITIELDHADGNRYNHKLENLRMLCPNCHSQTPSYRGRNKNAYAGVAELVDAPDSNSGAR